jgi:hypothetical protein
MKQNQIYQKMEFTEANQFIINSNIKTFTTWLPFLTPLLWTNLESLIKLVKGTAKILHMSFLIRA